MGLAKDMKHQAADKKRKERASKYAEMPELDVDGLEGILNGLDKDAFCDAILAVWRSGDAIMLGSTRDGGAATISIYEDGERVINKVYGNTADLERLLSRLLDAARGL